MEWNVFLLLWAAFPIKKATENGNYTIASRIRGETNPYQIKIIAKDIKVSQKWSNKESDVLKDTIIQKFAQNPEFRQKLVNSKYLQFYELTRDMKWGAGLKYQGQLPKKEEMTGQNLMGKILKEVKAHFTRGDH